VAIKTKQQILTALAVVYQSIQSLKPNHDNPRIHTDKQVRQIAQSIEAFGFNVPILVDSELNVIAGHGRLLAAGLLGWGEVPVIMLDHLNENQRRAFLIADNRLCENAAWNERLLGEQLKILSEAEIDFSLETVGFETSEIDLFIEGLSEPSEADSDPADEVRAHEGPVVSIPGDLWQLGKHRIFCGDSLQTLNYESLMNGKKARVVIADAPYNVRIEGHASGLGKVRHKDFAMASGEMTSAEYTDFLRRFMTAVAANSISGAIGFYFMDWRHLDEILTAGKQANSQLLNLCVWCKDNAGMGSFYRSAHEMVLVFKTGKGNHQNNVQLGQFGRYRTNVWNYPGANSFSRSGTEGNLLALHPTVKPVGLISDAIRDCSSRGDLVLDPFLGSGTTILAAERTGRVCYGLELDPKYVDTAVRRWQGFTGASAINAETGESFRNREEAAGEKTK
jgi:DNA modification methylase